MELTPSTPSQANTEDVLGNAVARVSTSLATLERVVERALAHAAVTKHQVNASAEGGINEANLISTVEKWRTRYGAMERERDELQEMLVALKRHYEEVAKQNQELKSKLNEIEVNYNRLTDVVDEVDGRLDISLGLIEEVLANG